MRLSLLFVLVVACIHAVVGGLIPDSVRETREKIKSGGLKHTIDKLKLNKPKE